MGQKMNPLGFRLGVTQSHRSHWFAQQKNYSEDLREDERIRNCIVNYVQRHTRSSSNHGGIARVEIRRKIDLIQVEIHIGFPNLLIESRGRGIEQLRIDVRNMLNSVDRKLNIAIVKVAKPYGEPNILAEFIALQLEDRVSLGRTVKKAIELAEQADIKGIQIQIAGRLDGNEIARVEWAREGRVPPQTIRAKIDYCYYPAQTIYGVLGIKIWIFGDEG
uniref:Small ribosomal subunit protein uS3c n=1 Tax=Microcycas calocoma TaxID=115879 RepID=A0A650DDF8_MICCL|nr:ribosomal protein S3 [Microcycas calocoma]QKN99158.1 ribosomal protein S3 [Microcycas calocoma]